MKNSKRFYIILAVIALVVYLAVTVITSPPPVNKQQLAIATEHLNIQKSIWDDIVNVCDKWVNGEITREQLAIEGNNLMQTYLTIEGDTLNNSNELISDSNSIKLETQVMLFDMIRGFSLEGNPYADKTKIEEEVLKYVYPKRAKTFYNLYDYFNEKYN